MIIVYYIKPQILLTLIVRNTCLLIYYTGLVTSPRSAAAAVSRNQNSCPGSGLTRPAGVVGGSLREETTTSLFDSPVNMD